MLQLMALGLLDQFGINVETCQVSLVMARTGNDLSFTMLPTPGGAHGGETVEHVRTQVLPHMRDGVTYEASANADGPGSFVLLIDGTAVQTDDGGDPVVENMRDIVLAAAGAIRAAAQLFVQPVDLSAVLTPASASSLRYAARRGQANLLVPGARPVACHCGGCGRDRRGKSPGPDQVGVITPTFTCGNPYFEQFATLFEQVAAGVLTDIELGQLRRLRIELREASFDLAVALPDDDVGEPSEDAVLYAEPPSHAAAVRVAPPSEILQRLLGSRDGRVLPPRKDLIEDESSSAQAPYGFSDRVANPDYEA